MTDSLRNQPFQLSTGNGGSNGNNGTAMTNAFATSPLFPQAKLSATVPMQQQSALELVNYPQYGSQFSGQSLSQSLAPFTQMTGKQGDGFSSQSLGFGDFPQLSTSTSFDASGDASADGSTTEPLALDTSSASLGDATEPEMQGLGDGTELSSSMPLDATGQSIPVTGSTTTGIPMIGADPYAGVPISANVMETMNFTRAAMAQVNQQFQAAKVLSAQAGKPYTDPSAAMNPYAANNNPYATYNPYNENWNQAVEPDSTQATNCFPTQDQQGPTDLESQVSSDIAKNAFTAMKENGVKNIDFDNDGVVTADEIAKLKLVAEGKDAAGAGLSPADFDKAKAMVNAMNAKTGGKDQTAQFLTMLHDNVDLFTVAADVQKPGSEKAKLGDKAYNGISVGDVDTMVELMGSKSLNDVQSCIFQQFGVSNIDQLRSQVLGKETPGGADPDQQLTLLVLGELKDQLGDGKGKAGVDRLLDDIAKKHPNADVDKIKAAFSRMENLKSSDKPDTLTKDDVDAVIKAMDTDGKSFEDAVGKDPNLEALKVIQDALQAEVDSPNGTAKDGWWNQDELNKALDDPAMFKKIVDATGLPPEKVGGPDGLIARFKKDFGAIAKKGDSGPADRTELENHTINMSDIGAMINDMEGGKSYDEAAGTTAKGAPISGADQGKLDLQKKALEYMMPETAQHGNGYGIDYDSVGPDQIETVKQKIKDSETDPGRRDALIAEVDHIYSQAKNLSGINGLEDNNGVDDNYNFGFLTTPDMETIKGYLDKGWTIDEMASKGSKVFEHLKQATTDFDENWAGNGSNSIDEDDTSDEAWKAANDLSNQAKAELDAGK